MITIIINITMSPDGAVTVGIAPPATPTLPAPAPAPVVPPADVQTPAPEPAPMPIAVTEPPPAPAPVTPAPVTPAPEPVSPPPAEADDDDDDDDGPELLFSLTDPVAPEPEHEPSMSQLMTALIAIQQGRRVPPNHAACVPILLDRAWIVNGPHGVRAATNSGSVAANRWQRGQRTGSE